MSQFQKGKGSADAFHLTKKHDEIAETIKKGKGHHRRTKSSQAPELWQN
jgi:hypothetical protein